MASFGSNLKLTIHRDHQDAVHSLFTEVLGCQSQQVMPGLSLYVFGDGACVGAYFGEQGLPDEVAALAPWLEFAVDDVVSTREALDAQGVERVPYAADPAHTYHRIPGGPVFRIA